MLNKLFHNFPQFAKPIRITKPRQTALEMWDTYEENRGPGSRNMSILMDISNIAMEDESVGSKEWFEAEDYRHEKGGQGETM